MSRIGKKPVAIPSGVDVTIDGKSVTVKGPKGTLVRVFHAHVSFVREGDTLLVRVANSDVKDDAALWGLSRQLLANMIEGVTKGFTKKLELVGVGYKAEVKGQSITLNLGYSHSITVPLPEGISATVEKNTFVTIEGIMKELVGNVAAAIRALRKPEPYQGKGVKYANEVIRRKLGKAAKSGA